MVKSKSTEYLKEANKLFGDGKGVMFQPEKSESEHSAPYTPFTKQTVKRSLSTFIYDQHSLLYGAAMINSNIMVLENHNTVLRKDHLMLKNQVKLITGGKTGHEPLFLSYVGPGVLTGAVIGRMNDPPKHEDIFVCLKELAYEHNSGIIAIVPNSFDEVVNFGIGIEKARCNDVLVDMVTIGDDCWESSKSKFGRRCLAGITLAFKIAGAMAEDKKSMKDIYLTLRKLCMGTISCHISNAAFIGTDLNKGSGVLIPSENFCEVVKTMLDYLVDPKKYFSLPKDSNSSYILMMNSYTYDRLFLYACLKEVIEHLAFREINIIRVFAGTFVSGERGFSITLLNTEKNIQLLRYADTACSCQFWPRIDARGVPLMVKGPNIPTGTEHLIPIGPFITKPEFIDIPLVFTCKALTSSEYILNKLDINHNFGTSLIPAVETIMKRCNEKEFPKLHPYNLLNVIAYICQDNISTIHGTFMYIFFLGAAQAFLNYSREVPVESKMWIEAIIRGVDSIKAYTQIKEEDHTFLSVLSPFACAMKFRLESKPDNLEEALHDSLAFVNILLKDSINLEVPGKRIGMPEVTAQATVIALNAIIEGIRFAIVETTKEKDPCSEESSDEN